MNPKTLLIQSFLLLFIMITAGCSLSEIEKELSGDSSTSSTVEKNTSNTVEKNVSNTLEENLSTTVENIEKNTSIESNTSNMAEIKAPVVSAVESNTSTVIEKTAPTELNMTKAI